jgi:gluconokinase
MEKGEPLDDTDRQPFLDNVAAAVRKHRGSGVIVSCSALKRSYRDRLRELAGPIFFVLPVIDRKTLERRLGTRKDHFMPASLLDSQLAALEPLQPDESGLTCDGAAAADDLAAQIMAIRTR